jgi:hypothetical protein
VAQKLRLTLAGKTYEFSEEDSTNTELMDLEEATGHELGEILEKLAKGSARSTTWILWLCMRREQPNLPLADVKFRPRDLGVEFLDDEQEPGKDEAPSDGK